MLLGTINISVWGGGGRGGGRISAICAAFVDFCRWFFTTVCKNKYMYTYKIYLN